MSTNLTSPISQQTNKAGLCPHGLPPAACPICSGAMGGGGGAKIKNSQPIKASNEWSFMKCYAVGLAMKAQEQRVENAQERFQKELEYLTRLGKNIDKFAEKIQNSLLILQNNAPQFLQKPIAFINNILITPFLNFMSNIPNLLTKFANLRQNINQIIQHATEKLIAIFGEFKKFIQKEVIEKVKKKLKKFVLLFFPEMEDENYNNEENLQIFKSREIKKYIIKIMSGKKKDRNRDKDECRND